MLDPHVKISPVVIADSGLEKILVSIHGSGREKRLVIIRLLSVKIYLILVSRPVLRSPHLGPATSLGQGLMMRRKRMLLGTGFGKVMTLVLILILNLCSK